MVVVLEIWHRIWLSKEREIEGPDGRVVEAWTHKAFLKQVHREKADYQQNDINDQKDDINDIDDHEKDDGKRKLAILDGWVVDFTEFRFKHPGGKYLLDRNHGKDISKYFHGGYSAEPKVDAQGHKHSNYALEIVKTLIVAQLGVNEVAAWHDVTLEEKKT
jgi:cytochrome b involved in lipid metabolism